MMRGSRSGRHEAAESELAVAKRKKGKGTAVQGEVRYRIKGEAGGAGERGFRAGVLLFVRSNAL
jgi:hypothetical protein